MNNRIRLVLYRVMERLHAPGELRIANDELRKGGRPRIFSRPIACESVSFLVSRLPPTRLRVPDNLDRTGPVCDGFAVDAAASFSDEYD